MPFLMSFALEHEIVRFAWIDNDSVQFPLNFNATKGSSVWMIQATAHGSREAERLERFLKEIESFLEAGLIASQVQAVAGREHHSKLGFLLLHLSRQIAAVHALR